MSALTTTTITTTKSTNTILNEESYFIDIYVDIMKDEYCLVTRYRFETKELAQQFIDFISDKSNIVYDSIDYESSRSITGYTDIDPWRPRFLNLQSAIQDFNDFIKYSHKYSEFKNDSDDSYIYKGNVFTENLNEFSIRYLEKKVEMLEKENQELKARLAKYEVV
jgi:hypothetical protein